MAAATAGSLSLEAAYGPALVDGFRLAPIRRDLGVRSFGIAALQAVAAGELLAEYDELPPLGGGHERLFVVLSGHAVFTVDDEEVDAPAGTVVHLPQPSSRRAVVAKEAGTTLLTVGGTPDGPYRETPSEELGAVRFYGLLARGEHEAAAAVCRSVLDRNPGNVLARYNLACCEALLGRRGDGIAHLAEAIAGAPELRETARTDTDLDALRGDPRFEELVA